MNQRSPHPTSPRRRQVAAVLALAALAFHSAGCGGREGGNDPSPDTAAPPLRWFKGNTHTHTLWSDGNDFPEMVADWYRSRGYHFLVLSDHNVLSRSVLPAAIRDRHARSYRLDPGFRDSDDTGQPEPGSEPELELWIGEKQVEGRQKTLGPRALDKYLQRFGDGWVETEGEPGSRSVRLKTLDEIRPALEEPGSFLLIEGEEITVGGRQADGRPLSVHINALNLAEPVEPVAEATTLATLRTNYAAVADDGAASGRPVLAHLNHPNFQWGVSAADLAAATNGDFYEVYNGHPGVNHLGDADHPGVERIWDIANTLRLTAHGAPPLFGVATDDAHEYHGGPVSPGRGWVMVRCDSLAADAVVEAMHRGDFYASSGVVLTEVNFDPDERTLTVAVAPDQAHGSPATFSIEFIGTRAGTLVAPGAPGRPMADNDPYPTRPTYPDAIGEVLRSVDGTRATYQLAGDELYVRARVTSSRPHPNPSFDGQLEQAWTQPVGWNLAPAENR